MHQDGSRLSQGDWNVNLMSHSHHQATGEFLELFYFRMFFPLITRPTRITSHKASLIDNIYTNNTLDHSTSGLFLNDISDHLMIYIFHYFRVQAECITFRDKNPINIEKFKLEFGNVNWAELPGYQDPNQAYGHFLKKYMSIYNLCFPLKRAKAKKQALRKPWFKKGLSKSVKS